MGHSEMLSLSKLYKVECFLLGREKNGHDTISWLHVCAVVHNSVTMRPIHEIIDCTTYELERFGEEVVVA
jgi:hypothetical protein